MSGTLHTSSATDAGARARPSRAPSPPLAVSKATGVEEPAPPVVKPQCQLGRDVFEDGSPAAEIPEVPEHDFRSTPVFVLTGRLDRINPDPDEFARYAVARGTAANADHSAERVLTVLPHAVPYAPDSGLLVGIARVGHLVDKDRHVPTFLAQHFH